MVRWKRTPRVAQAQASPPATPCSRTAVSRPGRLLPAVASRRVGKGKEAAVLVRRSSVAPCVTCCLCGGILRDATTVPDCLHTFCRKCIFQKITHADIKCCPSCNISLGHAPLEKLRADHSLQYISSMMFPAKRRKFEEISSPHQDLVSLPSLKTHGGDHSAKKTCAHLMHKPMNCETEAEAGKNLGMETSASPTKTNAVSLHAAAAAPGAGPAPSAPSAYIGDRQEREHAPLADIGQQPQPQPPPATRTGKLAKEPETMPSSRIPSAAARGSFQGDKKKRKPSSADPDSARLRRVLKTARVGALSTLPPGSSLTSGTQMSTPSTAMPAPPVANPSPALETGDVPGAGQAGRGVVSSQEHPPPAWGLSISAAEFLAHHLKEFFAERASHLVQIQSLEVALKSSEDQNSRLRDLQGQISVARECNARTLSENERLNGRLATAEKKLASEEAKVAQLEIERKQLKEDLAKMRAESVAKAEADSKERASLEEKLHEATCLSNTRARVSAINGAVTTAALLSAEYPGTSLDALVRDAPLSTNVLAFIPQCTPAATTLVDKRRLWEEPGDEDEDDDGVEQASEQQHT
ncbi:hypothetical protein EJB05_23520, partial [Eragrostis curvula]